MFSNVGFGEILVLLIVGFLLIGPERLPGLIKEARAVLLALRTTVAQAREQIDSQISDDVREFAQDVGELAKPLQQLSSARRMGAQGIIAKAILDGDDSFLTPLRETKQAVESTVNTVRDDAGTAGNTAAAALPVQQQAVAGESKTSDDSAAAMGTEAVAEAATGAAAAEAAPAQPEAGRGI